MTIPSGCSSSPGAALHSLSRSTNSRRNAPSSGSKRRTAAWLGTPARSASIALRALTCVGGRAVTRPASGSSLRLLASEHDERRQRIVPALGPHIAPDSHLQGQIGIERSPRIVTDQGLIGQHDQHEPAEMLAVVDDLAQYFERVQHCRGAVPNIIAGRRTGPAELADVESHAETLPAAEPQPPAQRAEHRAAIMSGDFSSNKCLLERSDTAQISV